MDLVEESYFTINKFFLKLLGIWPYDRSLLTLLQRVLIIILIVTCVFLELSVFITTNCNLTFFIKTMSLAFPTIIVVVKYIIYIFILNDVKILQQHIQEDWKLMKNKLETDILKEYAHDCRNYVIFIYCCSCLLVITILIAQFFPVILDFILPLDKPRLFKPFITLEYFVSMDDYFYAITLHILFLFGLFSLIMITTAAQMLLFTHHSLAMFKIVSYRIEHSFNDHISYTQNYERAFCEKIFHVVTIHRRATEYTNIFISSFNVLLGVIITLGVFSLSLNLFRFVQATTISKNGEDIIVSFVAILGHIVYMFIGNYIGQILTDYHNEIFKSLYGIPWYLMPVTSQKLILFLLQKTGKDVYYIVGYLYVAKIENFATLVNTALSYVTLMYSVQRE